MFPSRAPPRRLPIGASRGGFLFLLGHQLPRRPSARPGGRRPPPKPRRPQPARAPPRGRQPPRRPSPWASRRRRRQAPRAPWRDRDPPARDPPTRVPPRCLRAARRGRLLAREARRALALRRRWARAAPSSAAARSLVTMTSTAALVGRAQREPAALGRKSPPAVTGAMMGEVATRRTRDEPRRGRAPPALPGVGVLVSTWADLGSRPGERARGTLYRTSVVPCFTWSAVTSRRSCSRIRARVAAFSASRCTGTRRNRRAAPKTAPSAASSLLEPVGCASPKPSASSREQVRLGGGGGGQRAVVGFAT